MLFSSWYELSNSTQAGVKSAEGVLKDTIKEGRYVAEGKAAGEPEAMLILSISSSIVVYQTEKKKSDLIEGAAAIRAI